MLKTEISPAYRNHSKLKEFLVSIRGLKLISDYRTQHNTKPGHYFSFRANGPALKKICRLAGMNNCEILVYLDGWDKITYSLRIPYDLFMGWQTK